MGGDNSLALGAEVYEPSAVEKVRHDAGRGTGACPLGSWAHTCAEIFATLGLDRCCCADARKGESGPVG